MASGFKYQYGVKEVDLFYKQYKDASVYVSKPFIVDGSIVGVSLDSQYTEPLVLKSDDLYVCPTSVEFYVTATENPSANDWLPILPKSKEKITNEKLFFRNGSATLRFPCDVLKDIALYKNGVLQDEDSFDITYSSSGTSTVTLNNQYQGGAQQVAVDPRQSFYTIDYYPDRTHYDAWNISLDQLVSNGAISQSLKTQTDSFHGTDEHGMVYLSKSPYINTSEYASFNNTNPIAIYMSNANFPGKRQTIIANAEPLPASGSIVDGKAYTRNVTRYDRPDWNTAIYDLNAYDPNSYPMFEYYQSSRMIYFGETFSNDDQIDDSGINHGNADISVVYKYLITNLRVKIIVRQNPIYGNSFTPSVSSYSLNIKFSS